MVFRRYFTNRVQKLLSGPLTHIYNLSIKEKRFPNRWKLSHVCPIPKTRSPCLNDLRPISLLPLPSKIMERIVLETVRSQFVHSFGKSQFGARDSSSTTCAVISLLHHAICFLESPEVSGIKIVTYYLSKAFDTLSHKVILSTLLECGLPYSFISWTSDYLKGRSQATRDDHQSEFRRASGIRARSNALLFCRWKASTIFFGHLPRKIQ